MTKVQLFFGFLSLVAIPSPGATYYWRDVSGNWGTKSKWSLSSNGSTNDGEVPGSSDTAIFSATNVAGPATVSVISNRAAERMTFQGTATTLIGGSGSTHTLTLGLGGIQVTSATTGAVTIGSGSATIAEHIPVILAVNQAWTNASSNILTVYNGINLSTHTLTVDVGASAETYFGGDGGGITGTGNLTKTGPGILLTTGAHAVGGATTVSGGTLDVSSGTFSSGDVTVTGGARLNLGGSATLTATDATTPTVTVQNGSILSGTGTVVAEVNMVTGTSGGILAPTAAASGTALDVTGPVDFGSGSIFRWTINSGSGDYSQLAATGAATGTDAVFDIVLGGGGAFSDTFWDSDHSWSNVFSASGLSDLAGLFTSFSGAGVASDGTVAGRGGFSFSGTTLNWSSNAIPELSNGLIGLLLGAGLLRRRR